MELTSNPGASRWIVSSPGPGLVRQQVKGAKRAQLLQEAASMLPNESELAQSLMSRKLSPAESSLYQNALNTKLSEYVSQYRENPYYAFSREGVNKARELQSLVRDPRIKGLESAFEKSETEYKKLAENELLGNVSYDSGHIKAVNRKSGEVEEILPEQFDPSKHQWLDMNSEYDYTVNTRGFLSSDGNVHSPFSVNMVKLRDIISKVDTYLGATGSTKREEISNDGLLKVGNKSNSYQINSKLKALTSGIGLSDAELNTLYSQYYTKQLQGGNKVNSQDASRSILKFFGDIAQGHVETAADFSVNPQITAQKEAKETMTPLDDWTFASKGGFGTTPLISDPNNMTYWGRVQVNNLPNKLLNESADNYQLEDTSGAKIAAPKQNWRSLEKALFKPGDNENAYIMNMNTHQLERVPSINKNRERVQVTSAGITALPYIGEGSNKQYITPDDPRFREGLPVENVIVAKGKIGSTDNFWNDSSLNDDIDETMSNLGYKSYTLDSSKDVKDYYNNIISTDDDKGSNLTMYDMTYVVPLQGGSQNESILGARMTTDKDVFLPRTFVTDSPQDVVAKPTNPFIKGKTFDFLTQ